MIPQRRKSDGPIPLREAAFPPSVSFADSGVRDYLGNAMQILEAVIEDLHARDGEPFVVGMQDDLLGIRTRLRRALEILDMRP